VIAEFFFLLQIVAPIFIVMALGYAMRKIDILSSEADRSLTRLVVTLLAPCLAFDTIIGNEGLANPKNWILPQFSALHRLLSELSSLDSA
jgi:malate permease and related proteins